MKFTITNSVSNKDWSSVDKSRIWRMLKQGLEEGAEGVTSAIREVYAVVKADINKELTLEDCWGPHHEIRDDGSIVLNRAGLIAAAAALSGARSEPDLSPAQKSQAARHLLRHYRELELEPPESLIGSIGEMCALQALICGEMDVDDIPLAPWVDLNSIKAGDDSPMEVVVEVPAGKSKRGWNYRPEALQKIIGEVMNQGLPGFLGHQKPDEVGTQFPTPVTHWVGAKWENGRAYFRGVIDKAAADLKRWIKARTIRQVSIFGMPKLQRVNGEYNVVDYKPLSIDWTPLNRSGMPTKIVAMGEIDVIGEFAHEELRTLLREAVIKKLGINSDKDTLWVANVWDDHVVVEHRSNGITKYYDFPYSVLDGEITLGEKKEVVPKQIYEPVGEMNNGGGQTQMTWKEYVSKIKAMLQSGEVTVQQICGEMGWTAEQLAKILDPDWVNKVTGEMSTMEEIRKTVSGDKPVEVIAGAFETLDKVRRALDISGEMDVVKAAEDAKKALDEKARADWEKTVNEVIKEKVAGEMAQALVKKMLQVPEDATKEQIAGEIDKLLADETIKTAISRFHTDFPPVVGGYSGSGSGVVKKRTSSI